MINYEIVSASPQRFKIKVKLDGKHIGDIKHRILSNTYYYKVKGGPHVGEDFKTVAEVKRSLEG